MVAACFLPAYCKLLSILIKQSDPNCYLRLQFLFCHKQHLPAFVFGTKFKKGYVVGIAMKSPTSLNS